MSQPDQIHSLLAQDPLDQAERITGKSYKDDELTMGLGFALHLQHSKAKEAALREANDSHFRMDLADMLTLYAALGFTEVLCDEFTGRAYGDEPAPAETFRILWHPDGLLATVESYNGTGHNISKVYYNIAIANRDDLWSRTSSGHLTEGDVWVGDHDAREGIRANLDRLRAVGTFLPEWVESPFLWLLTYSDVDGDYDYKAINAERISRLPADVQRAIVPASRTGAAA